MGNDAFNLQKDQKATRHAGSHFDFSGADKDLEVLLAPGEYGITQIRESPTLIEQDLRSYLRMLS